MKKTIDQIVNNDEYKAINKALSERCEEIAKIIRREMNKLEINELSFSEVYRIISVKTNSGFSTEYLAVSHVEDVDLSGDRYGRFNSLEDDKEYYYAGDFNCLITPATGEDRLAFLNDAKSILEEIDKMKQQRIDTAKKALEETADIIESR